MGSLDIARLPEKIMGAYETVWDYFYADMPVYTTKLMQVAQWVLVGAGNVSVAVAVIGCFRAGRFAHAGCC